jgi:2-iminobutanoate/2-iminopropanoate deaminase
MPEVIATPDAPQAIGPYSQAIRANGFIFLSGQVAIDPVTGRFETEANVSVQTEQVLKNLDAILKVAGSGLDKVVRTTVYLKDMADFVAMNEVYARFFPTNPPARATVEAARLPKDARVEIDAIAIAG